MPPMRREADRYQTCVAYGVGRRATRGGTPTRGKQGVSGREDDEIQRCRLFRVSAGAGVVAVHRADGIFYPSPRLFVACGSRHPFAIGRMRHKYRRCAVRNFALALGIAALFALSRQRFHRILRLGRVAFKSTPDITIIIATRATAGNCAQSGCTKTSWENRVKGTVNVIGGCADDSHAPSACGRVNDKCLSRSATARVANHEFLNFGGSRRMLLRATIHLS